MAIMSNESSNHDIKVNPMSFTDQHGSVVLERLRYQRDTGRFCDVYLQVKDQRFSAHRNILASCSPYFDSIFKNSKVVKEQVTVNCQNPNVFELLLNYMYTGSVVIDRDNVSDLLKLANNFLVTKVKNYCAEYLDRYMEYSNCLTVKELAYKYNLPALLKTACEFFDANINRCLLESTDIVENSLSQINAILNEPKYNGEISPDVHLRLIIRWVNAYSNQRDALFKELLACCPFSRIQRSTLEELLDFSSFLNSSLQSRLILLETMYEHSMHIPKYQKQYQDLLAQFGNQVGINHNELISAHHQPLDNCETDQNASKINESEEFDGEIHDPNGSNFPTVCVDDGTDCHKRTECDDNSVQSPVYVATTASETSTLCVQPADDCRPSLKLKIHLDPLSGMNGRKRKAPMATDRQKICNKTVSNESSIYVKRRGRPPKSLEAFVAFESSRTNECPTQTEFIGETSREYPEPVVFDEDDEYTLVQMEESASMETTKSVKEGSSTESSADKHFSCEHCDYRTFSSLFVKVHFLREHTRNIVYVCTLCSFECRWNGEYYTHMQTHFSGPPFQCDVCEHANDQMYSLLIHRFAHVNDRPYKCTLCDYRSRSKSNLVSHVMNHCADKPYHCPECGRGFPLKSTMEQHYPSHFESRSYTCSLCTFSSKYQSHLISHRRTHTGDVFHCHYNDCSYSSPKKSQLAAHLRTHLAVRAHQCKVCNRSFIEKSHLVRHERIHLEDKPFKCDNCEYSSSRRDKLKEHIQKHHGPANVGKQNRRRYRRAKQLAQLAAQTNVQPNFAALFRPIQPCDSMDDPENGDDHMENSRGRQTNTGLCDISIPSSCGRVHNQGHLGDPELNYSQNIIDFNSMCTTENIPSRPCSARAPSPMKYQSPTTSLINFPLTNTDSPLMGANKDITLAGNVIDSPIDSLRTPLLRSPQSVTLQPFIDADSSPSLVQSHRPMSLPPYGGHPGSNSQIETQWISREGFDVKDRLCAFSTNVQDLRLFGQDDH